MFRCVSDDDGAFPQTGGPSWDHELREFLEHAGELVAAFAAAQIDDDVGIASFRQRLEHTVLPVPNPPGTAAFAAQRDGKQAIDDPLAG